MSCSAFSMGSQHTGRCAGLTASLACVDVATGERYDSMNFSEPFEFIMPAGGESGNVTERPLRKGVLRIGNDYSWSSAFLDDVPVHADVCDPRSALLEDIPATPDSVKAWLRSSPALTVSDPTSIVVNGRTALAFPVGGTFPGLCARSDSSLHSQAEFPLGVVVYVVYAIPTGDDTILYVIWSDGGDWPDTELPDQLVRSIVFR